MLTWRVLGQFCLLEDWHGLAVNSDDLVFLVEELDPASLPLVALLEAEEDEAAVALDITLYTVDAESLRNCGLHFANAASLGQVDLGQSTVFAMHDEVSGRTTLLGDFYEFVNLQSSRPCCKWYY